MKRILPLVLAFSLFAALAPSPAGAIDEDFSYALEPARTLEGSAQYQNQTPGDFAYTGVAVINFILNFTGATAQEDFSEWTPLLPADGPYIYTSSMTADEIAILDWVVDHYSGGTPVNRTQMLKFGASLLAFFVGLDASGKGLSVPVGNPTLPPTSTSSTTTLDPGDPCSTVPLPQASCGLAAWLLTWGSTIALLDQNVRTMSDAGPTSTCTDMRERARNMAVDGGPHAIAAAATAVQNAIEAYASLVSEGVYDCSGGGDRTAMINAVNALGVAAYGADFGWWLTNQSNIQHLENVIDSVLQYQYACDAIGVFWPLPAPPSADTTALAAALTALGTQDDCGFDDGAVTPASIAAAGDVARIAFDALMVSVRNGAANYPNNDPTFFGIRDELIAVRALVGEIDPASAPACEAIGFAATYMANAAAAVPGNGNVTAAKAAVDAMNDGATGCGSGTAAATYTAQQPIVASNLNTAIGWTVV